MSAPIPIDPAVLSLTETSTILTQILSTTSSSINSIQTAASMTQPAEPGQGKCELLGPFAILVQAALGGLALSSLVYKRWRERPQRPIKIWAFDVSKQVVGSILLHIANLLLSMISSGDLESGRAKGSTLNPCSFYLLNLAIDTTLGIPILILFLKVITVLASKTALGQPPESIKTGYYGDPPNVSWWIKQSFLYFIGLLCMKLVVAFLFKILPWLVYVGDWALKWTEGNEQLQIFFVMLFFPLVMNALQYYIIDGFIKGQKVEEHESEGQNDGNGDEEDRALASDWDNSFENEEVDALKRPIAVNDKQIPGRKVHEEYNPDEDGEQSSSSHEPGRRTGHD